VIVAGSSGSAAIAAGTLTGAVIEADGNERPAANPAAKAITTVATLRSKRRFVSGNARRRGNRPSPASVPLIAKA
jgi:hypothetical protein